MLDRLTLFSYTDFGSYGITIDTRVPSLPCRSLGLSVGPPWIIFSMVYADLKWSYGYWRHFSVHSSKAQPRFLSHGVWYDCNLVSPFHILTVHL